MTYEKTKAKPTSKDKETLHEMQYLPSRSIVWFLVKRHKFGLVITWAVVMTALAMVPALPEFVKSFL